MEQRNEIIIKKIHKILLPIPVFVILLIIWHLVSSSGLFLSSQFPSPQAVLMACIELAQNGVLLKNIGASLFRVFAGFGLAAITAIPCGFMLGRFEFLGHAFNPLIQLLRPISPIAWIPLAILWFGIGDPPAIFIIFITSFFPLLLTAAEAIKNINPTIIKSAINLGAKSKHILLKVALPATFPAIFVGLRVTLGIAWVIIVAAEMVGMRSGLGFMILDARNFLRIDMVISGMLTIGLIGVLLDMLMGFLEIRIRKHWGSHYEEDHLR